MCGVVAVAIATAVDPSNLFTYLSRICHDVFPF